MLTRRRLVIALGAGALTAPLQCIAQQTRRIPLVGVLWPNPPATFEFVRAGLTALGYIENQNIRFEYFWAQDKLDKLPELAAELVSLKVDLILTLAPPAAVAVKNATQSIPIVCVGIGDPVASGLVTNLAHPGGNLTGTTRMLSEMSVKHLEFLKEVVPLLSRVAVLWNPANSSHPPALKAIETTAHSLSVRIQALPVQSLSDLDNVFAAIAKERANGIVFLADPIFFINLARVTQLIAAARLPAVSNFTEYPKLGGLMGYSPSIADEFQLAASHIDKILKGAKPGDLPIQQPTKFEMVINGKTAKALGLTIPPSILLRADKVIE